MSCVCDGRCCAVFTFSSSIDDLRESVAGTLVRNEKPIKIVDDEVLLDMFIPLTQEEAAERRERFGLVYTRAPEGVQCQQDGSAPPDQHYTCRHWDEDTGLCGIYEDRPNMCRDFPYGKVCTHGCGYNNADDPALPDRYKIVVEGGEARAEQDS